MKKRNFIQCAAFFAFVLAAFTPANGSSSFPPAEALKPAKSNMLFVSPSVQFNNIRTEHNVHENGRKGMRIHIDFTIKGMAGKACRAVAYFYDEYGYALQDQGGGYRTSAGTVSSGRDFTPPYETSRNSDMTIFMPYGELHVDGTFSLKYNVSVFYHDMKIGFNSNWETFRLTWRTNLPESDCPKCGC